MTRPLFVSVEKEQQPDGTWNLHIQVVSDGDANQEMELIREVDMKGLKEEPQLQHVDWS